MVVQHNLDNGRKEGTWFGNLCVYLVCVLASYRLVFRFLYLLYFSLSFIDFVYRFSFLMVLHDDKVRILLFVDVHLDRAVQSISYSKNKVR